jgi:hypothetical protein
MRRRASDADTSTVSFVPFAAVVVPAEVVEIMVVFASVSLLSPEAFTASTLLV